MRVDDAEDDNGIRAWDGAVGLRSSVVVSLCSTSLVVSLILEGLRAESLGVG